MSPLVRLIEAYLAPEGDLALQGRYYQGLCLLTAILLTFIVVPGNVLLGLPLLVNLAACGLAVVAFLLFVAARGGRYYTKSLLFALMLTLNATWFPNAGNNGSIGFFFFPAVMYPVVFFRGLTRVTLVGLVLVDYVVLLWVEAHFPGLTTPFADSSSRLMDLASGFVGSCVIVVAMISVILSVYHRDRERLRTAVQSLAESRTLLSTLIDSTGDLMWLVDPGTYRLAVCNAAFVRYFREIRGVHVRAGASPEDLMPADVAGRWRGYFDRALTEGPFTEEYVTSPEGLRLLLSFHVVRHDQQVLGISVFAKDITALRHAEDERERVELQLLQAQKMESLGSLAGGVAHDFNNMLAGIMGYADLLMADETVPVRKEHLGAIMRAATRSGDLTRKLLAFARRGKNIVEAVDLAGVVRESLAILTPSFRPDVTVSLQLDAASTVDGDPTQINQVVINLCINANEAMPHGGRLSIRTREVSLAADAAQALELPPGDYVQLVVADSGVGMSDEVRLRIFEPFFTTKHGSEVTGTGLGLSTVYGIVHLHRGAITVSSVPNRGAAFTLYFPKGVLTAPPATSPGATSAGAGLVLVVEDEELLRRLATTALTRLGYRSITAEDGVQAVEIFRQRHRELVGVVLDLKMPRKGGREAFLEMRAIDPSVPVLLCSGYGENEEAQGLISLGARGLLSKPYRIGELSEHLARFGA
jgi:signal transduction histidine kinase